ncbi:TFIIB-type zinc ribbon-containing protein [Rhizobium sp.]
MVYDNNGTKRGGGMLCPVCRVGLIMAERQGVEIDYCPECRGVWLDRGELDKIIERSGAAEAPRPVQQRQDQPVYDNYGNRPGNDGHGHGSHGYDSHGHGQRHHDDRGHHGNRGHHGSFLRRLFD